MLGGFLSSESKLRADCTGEGPDRRRQNVTGNQSAEDEIAAPHGHG